MTAQECKRRSKTFFFTSSYCQCNIDQSTLYYSISIPKGQINFSIMTFILKDDEEGKKKKKRTKFIVFTLKKGTSETVVLCICAQ